MFRVCECNHKKYAERFTELTNKVGGKVSGTFTKEEFLEGIERGYQFQEDSKGYLFFGLELVDSGQLIGSLSVKTLHTKSFDKLAGYRRDLKLNRYNRMLIPEMFEYKPHIVELGGYWIELEYRGLAHAQLDLLQTVLKRIKKLHEDSSLPNTKADWIGIAVTGRNTDEELKKIEEYGDKQGHITDEQLIQIGCYDSFGTPRDESKVMEHIAERMGLSRFGVHGGHGGPIYTKSIDDFFNDIDDKLIGK